jgi:hypothetical protein
MLPKLIDQIEQGLARNIDFLDKDNFNKLVQLFLEQVQEIEVATLSIADQKNINTAIGVWLDYIGKIVGEARKSRTDTEYRAALLLKIAANNSDGTPNVIIDITKQYSGASNSKIIQYFPAYFFNVLQIADGESTLGIANLLDTIKPAGVGVTVVNNINGNRFVPSWITGDYYLTTLDLLLTSAGVTDTIEINGVDNLEVSRSTYSQVNTEYAYLDWIGLAEFGIFSGGEVTSLELDDGSIFGIATTVEDSVGISEGLLAQVII